MSEFKKLNIDKLSWFVWRHCLIGFNSIKYDMLILTMLLYGYQNEAIFKASSELVLTDKPHYILAKELGLKTPDLNHIDLIEVAPLKGSLKLYGGRMHCRTMRELPYTPDKKLTADEMKIVVDYCCNDLDITQLLYEELLPHIELRESMGKEYSLDLRSKSDAQMAEAIIKSELKKITGVYPKKPNKVCDLVKFEVPNYICFQNASLKDVVSKIASHEFQKTQHGFLMPDFLKESIELNGKKYQLGMGGLHSKETNQAVLADEETHLIDRDVASYYPRIILNQQLYPDHLGIDFLVCFDSLVERRLVAKKQENKKTSEGLKVTINGTFGKLGDDYSIINSPRLLLQVTISGQLSILMLIEGVESTGAEVISANTDGIIIKCPRYLYKDVCEVIAAWERHCKFQTEETKYSAVYSRDVNSYIALKNLSKETDKEKHKRLSNKLFADRLGCKVKGFYSEVGSAQNSPLSRNPENQICKDALIAFLIDKTPLEKTIKESKDFRRFLTIRNVKGGGIKDGHNVGKVIRTYYAANEYGDIKYKTTNNRVSNTIGAKPVLVLPEKFPDDLNYERYIEETYEMLFDVGYYKRASNTSLF